MYKLSKLFYYLKRYGLIRTIKKIISKIFKLNKKNNRAKRALYKKWITENEPMQEELKLQKKYDFKLNPKISIVVPMYNTDENNFLELLNSLFAQTYSNWELCLADGSIEQNKTIFAMCMSNKKIKYQFLNGNMGISQNTNKAMEMAEGDFIAFLDHDDCLSPFALYEVVKTINENPNVEFIYSDEDKIDEKGERFDPYFKPDFSPETLECNNYITHLVVVKKSFADKIGKLDSRFDGAQDFDYVLRATENTKNIVHIQKILYHWKANKNSTANVAEAKKYAYDAGKKVVEEHLKRMNKEGTVIIPKEIPGVYQIKYKINGEPKVSIITNANDKTIKEIRKITTYQNYEIVKNLEEAKGNFIIKLNGNYKILTPNWLELFIGYGQQKDIGAVGARIYNKNMTLKSAGVGQIEGEIFAGLPFGKHDNFGRDAATRDVMAVDNDCIFVKKEVFTIVGRGAE